MPEPPAIPFTKVLAEAFVSFDATAASGAAGKRVRLASKKMTAKRVPSGMASTARRISILVLCSSPLACMEPDLSTTKTTASAESSCPRNVNVNRHAS